MEDVTCKKCGLINDYSVKIKPPHHYAYCNGCESFIKFIPHDTPKFYFGKHKGTLISECTDVGYMEWVIGAGVVKGNIKTAILDRLDVLIKKNGGKE
jgi:hypothetical protein